MSEDRERAIQAILDTARRARRPIPRWLWLVTALIGLACTIGFVIVLRARPAPSTGGLPRAAPQTSGFAAGLGIGGAAGLVIGLAIGVGVVSRRHRDPRHSSRSKP